MTINTWKYVGFIPMTANATKDPKISYQLGEGGASDSHKEQLELLVSVYNKIYQSWGLMERCLIVNSSSGDKAAIKMIMKNGSINKVQSLYMTGISIAICLLVLEALTHKKMQENGEVVIKPIHSMDGVEGVCKVV